MTAPAWASALGPGLDPELVAAVLRAASAGCGGPAHQRAVLADRLRDNRPTGAGDVVDDLLRRARARTAVTGSGAADSARRLLAVRARVVIAGEPGYPPRLAAAWPELGAPAWLFVRGAAVPRPDVLGGGAAVAVVGTRRATLTGRYTARQLAASLAERGAAVVSGMARGIDQAAHRGALDVEGTTIAVLGTGFGVDYPRGDGLLREAVAAAGALVTEYLPGAPPRAEHFLWRNRIISALTDSTVVVEGRERSGALHTARLAAAQGRDVFAVPGSLHNPVSRGPLDLIRDGAQVLTCFEDVLGGSTALPPPHAADRAVVPPGAARRVLSLLSDVPASPADLAAVAGEPIGVVLAALAELQSAGLALATPRGAVHAPAGAGTPAPRDRRSGIEKGEC